MHLDGRSLNRLSARDPAAYADLHLLVAEGAGLDEIELWCITHEVEYRLL